MFAVAAEPVEFSVLTPDGVQPVDLGEVLARVRGDLDLPALLPPFLCETVEGAVEVSWDEEVYECSQG